MQTIPSTRLRITTLTSGKSALFTDVVSSEQYYASRRVANEILEAQNIQKDITVWVQKIESVGSEYRPTKPYERLSWLATPSRF